MPDFKHIVCPHCSSVNRIPIKRMAESPTCGKCKRGLFMGHPAEVIGSTFLRHISRSDIPVLVDFWAPWCGPCKTMIPIFKQVAVILEPDVRLVKVNTEQEKVLATRYNIRSIPTLALFKNGEEIARQSGVMNVDDLVLWVRSRI
ncbi:MAG: thioredoxin TrxC [Pseudomonadota bacterium]|nr:thioredoxin TrxC [Pseudomonadota bacterium]